MKTRKQHGRKRFRSLFLCAALMLQTLFGILPVSGAIVAGAEETGDELLLSQDFEAGYTPFVANSSTISLSDGRNGSRGLLVSQRVSDWNSAEVDLLAQGVQANETYKISLYFKADSGMHVICMVEESAGGTDYKWLSSKIATGDWVLLEGEYVVPENLTGLKLRCQSSNTPIVDFSIDDFCMTKLRSTLPEGTGMDLSLTPIKDVYKDDFLVGSIYNPARAENPSSELTQLLLHHFNTITPENLMKPAYMQPSPGNFFFTQALEMFNFAQDNHLNVVGHTFVWHSQSGWMETAANLGDRETALDIMENHIKTIAEAYVAEYGENGPMVAFDVVNEAFSDGGSLVNGNWKALLRTSSAWYKAIGEDYIEHAFRFARQYLPENVKLYYNDYNLDNSTKSKAVYEMVKEFKEKGVPIDGVGMQSHYSINTSVSAVEDSIKRFASLGVEISITELDVGAGVSNGQLALDSQAAVLQGQHYAQLFQLYKKYSDSIARVTFWGIDDASSWRSESAPCLFSSNYTAKLAYEAVADPAGFLAKYPLPVKPVPKRAAAAFERIGNWAESPEIAVDTLITGTAGSATATAKVNWDNENLYIRMEVQDATPDVTGSADHEQDSVEIFLDLSNDKSPSYVAGDDYQLRVSRANRQSAGGTGIYPGMASTVVDNGTEGYVVEVILPVSGLTAGQILGMDLQINDCEGGRRTGVVTFNETKGTAWSTTENWGELELVAPCAIAVAAAENGTISADRETAYAGRTVTVSAVPDEGYQLVKGSLNVYRTGDETAVVNLSEENTFSMPGYDVTVTGAFEAVEKLQPETRTSFVNGYPDGTFLPNGKITRAEAASLLYELLEVKDVAITKTFTDIKGNPWYKTRVETLASLGMLTGYGNGSFQPNNKITRAEFVTMLVNFAEVTAKGTENTLKDVNAKAWYFKYVQAAYESGWIKGYQDGTFRPGAAITRAEAVALISRMQNRVPDKDYISRHFETLNPFKDLSQKHWACYEILDAAINHTVTLENGAEVWQ